MTPLPKHFITRDGVRLHVDDQGGAGAIVLFQHGLCGDAAQTAEAFPPSTTFRRITLEMRGHGRSETGAPEKFSLAQFTADIADFLEQTALGPVVVGGISMGAALALRLAVMHPARVKSLILARPAWGLGDAPANMLPNAFVGHLLRDFEPAKAIAAFEASDWAARLAAEARDNLATLRRLVAREPFAVTAELLSRLSADGVGLSAGQLRKLAVPTLIIAHDLDVIHPLTLALELTSLIPSARFQTITPKAIDKERYVQDFHNAMLQFLQGPAP